MPSDITTTSRNHDSNPNTTSEDAMNTTGTTTQKPASTASHLTARTLEQTPSRVLTFLSGAGLDLEIRGLLDQHGYSREVHRQGWRLLEAARTRPVTAWDAPTDPIGDAIRAVESWNAVGYHVLHAHLANVAPAVADYVFQGLAPATGMDGVMIADTVLARLDALRDATDPARATLKDSDAAVLAALAKRGIGTEAFEALRAAVTIAQEAKDAPPPPPSDDAREAALGELRAWYEQWTEIARAVLPSRRALIRLGLAQRQSRSAAKGDAAAATAASPAPSAPSEAHA